MTQPIAADRALTEAEAHFRAGDETAAVELLLFHLNDYRCALRLREWAVAERRLELLPRILDRLTADAHPEAAVSAAIALQLKGDAAAALATLKPVLGAHPELASAHHHAGRALHNLGRRAEALAALRLAVQLRPEYPEAWYSLAHALRAAGRMEESIAAYRTALKHLPALRAALLNLGITLVAVERPEDALECFDRLLVLDPDGVEGRINRGLCLHVLGRITEARDSLERALRSSPEHPMAHFYLGCLLNEQMDSAAAREHLEAALRVAPDDPDVLAELAGLMEQLSDLAAATRHVIHGLAVAPGHPGLTLEAARLARREGKSEEARGRLFSLDATTLPSRVAQQYWFERVLVHDRGGEYEPAMEALQRAHTLAAASPRRRGIDRDAFPRRVDEIARWLQHGAPGALPQPGDPLSSLEFRPAFLVGFPRSGTTLLDTLLDAHPEVASIEERPAFEQATEVLSRAGSDYPVGMESLASHDLARLQTRYGEEVRSFLPAGFGGVVLDKLPLRLLRVPLIQRLFPEAPILFVLRHPCDVVLSNVMQQYRPNEAFIHFDTVEDAARTYDRVMRVWRGIVERMPLRVHYVRYEALVADPEQQLVAACAALGIAPVAAMLDPARRLENRGRIQTNSYQQVAEPVYRRAVGRWQNYRRWLEPVLPLLRPHLEWLQYDED